MNCSESQISRDKSLFITNMTALSVPRHAKASVEIQKKSITKKEPIRSENLYEY